MLAPGDVLRDYTILAPIRSGGMGTLYLASRRGAAGFSRAVAIKVIRQDLAADPEFVRMFIEEARLCAAIHDPHVVHVEELAEERGSLFIVMEYVHGCALAQLLSELARVGRRLSPEIATAIAMHVAAGLHAAHEVTSEDGEKLGIVHRDVSPHNVLLARQGYVKLIDFGIAAAGRGRSATGSLRGKIAYMSPEQASGDTVDHRTDIYALGVVLWEMLTGRRLFDAPNDAALLELVRAAKPAGPREIDPELPSALDEVVRLALAPAPERRPPSAKALRSMLMDAVPGALKVEAGDIAQLVSLVVDDARLTGATLQEAVAEAKAFERTPSRLTGDEGILQTLSLASPTMREAPLPDPRAGRSVRGTRLAVLGAGALALVGIGLGVATVARDPEHRAARVASSSADALATPVRLAASAEAIVPPSSSSPAATVAGTSSGPLLRVPGPKAPPRAPVDAPLPRASTESAMPASASSPPSSSAAPRVLMIDGVPIVAPP